MMATIRAKMAKIYRPRLLKNKMKILNTWERVDIWERGGKPLRYDNYNWLDENCIGRYAFQSKIYYNDYNGYVGQYILYSLYCSKKEDAIAYKLRWQ